MNSSDLLRKIKKASSDGENFSFVLSTINDYEDQEVIKTAKWLEREMYIRLRECEVQKVGNSKGVFLSGKILDL
jgi:hypothetical protein